MRALKWWLVALGAIGLTALAVGTYLYVTAPERLVRGALAYERRVAGLERKEITLTGGLRYVYLEGGRGAPLLLLHGFGANKDNFTRIAKYLTPHYRVIVPDHAGFGESSKPPQADYGPRAQAERLHAFARALGASQLHLGGNSMGGHVALTYAALYPKDVQSLWLLNAAGVWSAQPSELLRKLSETGENLLLVQDEDDFAALLALVTAKPLMIPRPFLDVLAQERIRNYALEERIFKQLAADSVEERIRGLAVPALIVWGQQDRVLHPGSAGVLQMLLVRSEVIMMPGVGHVPMLEQPERTALDYLRFRATL
ncbi:MAG: alpha/beta hydrolase [Betaproteobacteria bacterium]|nr:alpha/beta hydrolase [Betaproteobacteria bacterium]